MEFASFWYGGQLRAVEQCCIRSFLRCGHTFSLYSYDLSLDVPHGCKLLDASEFYPERSVFFYRGSGKKVSAFSNMFRYQMVFQTGQCWVDTDVVCNSDRFPNSDYLFARQDEEFYNAAILRFPAGHEAMKLGAEFCWEVRDTARWGDLGPRLFTEIVKEYGLEPEATDTARIYPLHWREAMSILDPSAKPMVEQRLEGALTLHLWNEIFSRNGIDPSEQAASGSYLKDLMARLAG